MVNRLLEFLDASPVNFLAAHNIAGYLEQAGYRRFDPQQPIGQIKAGDKLYVTKNDSSIYAFHIGRLPLACAALNMTHINVHLLTIEAAVKRSRQQVYEAAMLDPHTRSELTLDAIRALCDDLFEAHQKCGMIPEYK